MYKNMTRKSGYNKKILLDFFFYIIKKILKNIYFWQREHLFLPFFIFEVKEFCKELSVIYF